MPVTISYERKSTRQTEFTAGHQGGQACIFVVRQLCCTRTSFVGRTPVVRLSAGSRLESVDHSVANDKAGGRRREVSADNQRVFVTVMFQELQSRL